MLMRGKILKPIAEPMQKQRNEKADRSEYAKERIPKRKMHFPEELFRFGRPGNILIYSEDEENNRYRKRDKK